MKETTPISPELIRELAGITRFISLVIAENRIKTDGQKINTLDVDYIALLRHGLKAYLDKHLTTYTTYVSYYAAHSVTRTEPAELAQLFPTESPFMLFVNNKNDDYKAAIEAFYKTVNEDVIPRIIMNNPSLPASNDNVHCFDKIKNLDARFGADDPFVRNMAMGMLFTAFVALTAVSLVAQLPTLALVSGVVGALITACAYILIPETSTERAEKMVTAAENGTGKTFRLSTYRTADDGAVNDYSSLFPPYGNIYTPGSFF